ncbi:uncharacterized protein LOC108094360 [Drosophila ficusphila]|uniref:uncharacterized protein LOC108094360 n=1 Tax=Drosophila ficusphila TaxID=30025 RepID=UPI0007E859B3|nr:uncharacterized protein LOC108094360 [Drosophila ficusphila]
MDDSHCCRKEFEVCWVFERSQEEYLPPFRNEPIDDRQVIGNDSTNDFNHSAFTNQEQTTGEERKRRRNQEPTNTFWVSVSDYELDRAYVVYRFFHDIGIIVAKSFTQTNRMYLKYLSMVDCQIALSYDGQKIGYGGDIRVKVKAENPATENDLIEALESCSHIDEKSTDNEATSTMTATIDVNNVNDVNNVEDRNEVTIHQMETAQSEKELQEHIFQKVGFLQWLKEKLSYVFYFY